MSSSIHDTRDKEIIKEYYLFLYELATKKGYEHSSHLTDEEAEYCQKLLSQSKSSHYQSKELYLSLMEDILTEAIRRKNHTR